MKNLLISNGYSDTDAEKYLKLLEAKSWPHKQSSGEGNFSPSSGSFSPLPVSTARGGSVVRRQVKTLNSHLESIQKLESCGVLTSSPCNIKIVVYKLAPGMYHSGLLVDNTKEWHFWEGSGIRCSSRTKNDILRGRGAIPDLEMIDEIDCGFEHKVTRQQVEEHIRRLATRDFNIESYDILNNNCNHFVQKTLSRLGIPVRIPGWINRPAKIAGTVCHVVPFSRRIMDYVLGRTVKPTTTKVNPFIHATSRTSGTLCS